MIIDGWSPETCRARWKVSMACGYIFFLAIGGPEPELRDISPDCQADNLPRFLDCGVIGPAEVVGLRQNVVKERTDRIEIKCMVGFGLRLGEVALHDEQIGKTIREVWDRWDSVRWHGAIPSRRWPSPSRSSWPHCRGQHELRRAGIELQARCAASRAFTLASAGGIPSFGTWPIIAVAAARAGIGFGIRWIFADGFLKKGNAVAQAVAVAKANLPW